MFETRHAIGEMTGISLVGNFNAEAIEAFKTWADLQFANSDQGASNAGRIQLWYGKKVNAGKTIQVVDGGEDERINQLGSRLLPGWNSAILSKYFPGAGLKTHTDPICFSGNTVFVNIGKAVWFSEEGRYKRTTELKDGMVLRYNPRHPHGIDPVREIRYSLVFRLLKAEYLTPSLLDFRLAV